MQRITGVFFGSRGCSEAVSVRKDWALIEIKRSSASETACLRSSVNFTVEGKVSKPLSRVSQSAFSRAEPGRPQRVTEKLSLFKYQAMKEPHRPQPKNRHVHKLPPKNIILFHNIIAYRKQERNLFSLSVRAGREIFFTAGRIPALFLFIKELHYAHNKQQAAEQLGKPVAVDQRGKIGAEPGAGHA